MPTIVPVPRARTLSSKMLRAGYAPSTSARNPTQVAPDLLTIGIRAAANPPEIGPSAFAPATRLETTTTLTTVPEMAVEARVSAFFRSFYKAGQTRLWDRQPKGSPSAGRSCPLARKNPAMFLKA
jgi:hypothetical protein